MESIEEINKELENKLRRLEEDIISVIEYNNKLKAVLESLKVEEKLTLEWLTKCLNNARKSSPQSPNISFPLE